jgi:NitT/TauT family transport system ATP-binding protein
MLAIRDLQVSFAHDGRVVRALDGIDLDVPAGQFVVLIGPSGQGKSTLLNAIAGLVAPTGGSILADAEPVSGPSPQRGMVFQADTAFPWLRVRDNVAYGLKARGVPAAARRATVDRYLQAVGLDEFAGSWPRELSGGMRKRVAVATAFAADPALLLMDEPFGSLDFVTRSRLHALLLALWQETGKTILFVTHDVDETLLLADRVLVLSRGRIVDDLAVDFARPRTDALRSEPAAVELRRRLLERLGLDQGVVA